MKEILKKLNPKYRITLSTGKRVLAISLLVLSACWTLVVTEYGLAGFADLVYYIFPILILAFSKNHIEFAFIPFLIKTISGLTFSMGIGIGTIAPILIIAVIILSLYTTINKQNSKAITIAVIVICIARILSFFTGIIYGHFDFNNILLNDMPEIFEWFALLVLFSKIKNEEAKKDGYIINLIITILIFAVLSWGVPAIYGLISSSDGSSSGGCGHAACEENGPFPCMGKGNTCTNTTSCSYDLYCSSCD